MRWKGTAWICLLFSSDRQGRFIHKAEEAEASGPTKPRGPPSLGPAKINTTYNTENTWEKKIAIILSLKLPINIIY